MPKPVFGAAPTRAAAPTPKRVRGTFFVPLTRMPASQVEEDRYVVAEVWHLMDLGQPVAARTLAWTIRGRLLRDEVMDALLGIVVTPTDDDERPAIIGEEPED